MRVGILGNAKKIKSTQTVEEIAAFLEQNGYETARFSSYNELEGVDVALILGGDGALLHASVVAAQRGVKVIGINYGTLGFLTEYEKDERERVKELLDLLRDDACRIIKRSLLQLTLGDKTFYALNEISVQRDYSADSVKSPQILSLEIEAKEGKDVIAGDGLLFCTPTGSTAYSLSAGGAILTPEVPVFMMTPICAFSMRARPIVFSDTEKFTLRVVKGKAVVLCDGGVAAAIPAGAELTIQKAPFTADFPVKENSDFLARVRNKLNG